MGLSWLSTVLQKGANFYGTNLLRNFTRFRGVGFGTDRKNVHPSHSVFLRRIIRAVYKPDLVFPSGEKTGVARQGKEPRMSAEPYAPCAGVSKPRIRTAFL